MDLNVGGKYNWKNQSERMIYLGHDWSGNEFWHQFSKAAEEGEDQSDSVWCEILDRDLHMIEESEQTLTKIRIPK